MRVDEESEDRLVLRDTQLDKKLGISVLAVFLLFVAFLFAEGGDWIEASIPVALAAIAIVYLKLTLLSAVVTFDRATDRVTLSVTGRKGSEEWNWKLSDLKGAEVSVIRGSGDSRGSGRKQPVIVLQDSTRVPIRPYHSAGAQSWNAVIAIRRFIGQEKMDDLPVGWISDD
ncbi:MAG: hypothetical protein OEN23_17380 [Paracoccaceae bacterium]|nr:hypothetical protein [Paracoccaceae bacterium]